MPQSTIERNRDPEDYRHPSRGNREIDPGDYQHPSSSHEPLTEDRSQRFGGLGILGVLFRVIARVLGASKKADSETEAENYQHSSPAHTKTESSSVPPDVEKRLQGTKLGDNESKQCPVPPREMQNYNPDGPNYYKSEDFPKHFPDHEKGESEPARPFPKILTVFPEKAPKSAPDQTPKGTTPPQQKVVPQVTPEQAPNGTTPGSAYASLPNAQTPQNQQNFVASRVNPHTYWDQETRKSVANQIHGHYGLVFRSLVTKPERNVLTREEWLAKYDIHVPETAAGLEVTYKDSNGALKTQQQYHVAELGLSDKQQNKLQQVIRQNEGENRFSGRGRGDDGIGYG